MRHFSLSLSLLSLLSLSLGCLNEEGASFGETGMENTIVADAGPPPGDQTSDASAANQEEPPPELPLVDPDCPSLRLMEFKSAELGPEGGKIELSFTKLTIPDRFLKETTNVTIARYGISKEASPYDYYILLPDGLKAQYRKFDIVISIGSENSDVYPENSAFGYIYDNDFWNASASHITRRTGFFMGFFRRFGKIGIREEIRQKSNICPTDEGIKSKSKAIKGEIPSGQSYVGKCFSAEYKLTTEGCENYGAICHKGLAGNFLCESCVVKTDCSGSSSLQCCHTCETDPDMQRDFPCSETTLSLVSEDVDCVIQEYYTSCLDFQENGSKLLGGLNAETEVQCNPSSKKELQSSIKNGQTCILMKTTDVALSPVTILRYPKIMNLSTSCEGAWSRFDCELRKHEEEHYHIGMSICENVRTSLTGLSSGEHCSEVPEQAENAASTELDSLIDSTEGLIYHSGQNEQDSFDEKTNHGGVYLACPC